ncbi:heme-binding protein [Hymenobacter lucidus]|uniref:Uncharacterized protein n=1 Tax=Hymenobacter lucidus TaxID=2880930 RepID=A0ABS8AL35_9BACT|nr:heme-binding protein [Hymenobacter lucidus]MCB2406913.1 hypothetical protein [Hymenobacter lucidus]
MADSNFAGTTGLHVMRLGGSAEQTENIFGPLAGLIGSWIGNKGWNLIAVPNQKGGFVLLVTPYIETLTISPLATPTPNRGTKIIQEVPTLLYELKINSLIDGSLLHAENGTWLLLPDCPSEFGVARQASVPHGDSLLALGQVKSTSGGPSIPDISSIPDIGGQRLGYLDVYSHPPVPGFNKLNPNDTLRRDNAAQTIVRTTTIAVSTDNQGGILNIPFVARNADASKFEATFWLETVADKQTGRMFQQLQYSQNTSIDFLPRLDGKGLIKWPHININTLIKQ